MTETTIVRELVASMVTTLNHCSREGLSWPLTVTVTGSTGVTIRFLTDYANQQLEITELAKSDKPLELPLDVIVQDNSGETRSFTFAMNDGPSDAVH